MIHARKDWTEEERAVLEPLPFDQLHYFVLDGTGPRVVVKSAHLRYEEARRNKSPQQQVKIGHIGPISKGLVIV